MMEIGLYESDSQNRKGNMGHNIRYTAGAEYWYCTICGAKGLDGEHEQSDTPCID